MTQISATSLRHHRGAKCHPNHQKLRMRVRPNRAHSGACVKALSSFVVRYVTNYSARYYSTLYRRRLSDLTVHYRQFGCNYHHRCMVSKSRAVTPASTRNHHRREEDSYRKAGIFLEDLPVRRYTKRLVPAEKSNGEAQNAAWNTYPLKLFHPMRKCEVPRATDDKASVLVTRSNESPMVNDPDTSRL